MRINIEDFTTWYEKEEITYACDSLRNIKLNCVLSGLFRIYEENILIWEGYNKVDAIEKYNNL